eukprot:CAMPEP_0170537908 /NCGR_PEP_ID=MMETSP0209-20121228/102997_1 /TAXON_ID=665100 ORGANISM="Litonotus pictus, Strain P1" /NCGR_SAMPLE_ID=MMETSP0209 /ASSEMBLY_ACC=CAM_ASM_000301 /LENGTH=262 /DNA_ID=CAMNT_0010839501 /DNA_START=84 /DNA_END=869 /DNA_ORIENTATION=+
MKTGLKQNSSTHLRELKIRAEKDPKVRKYCREIEEKIEKDIEFKLSNNYYEQKNKVLEKIFKDKPENYYEKKLNTSNRESDSKNNTNNVKNVSVYGTRSKSNDSKVNVKSDSNHYTGKDNLLTGVSMDKSSNQGSHVRNKKPYNAKKNKKNFNADKKKSLKSLDWKNEYEKVQRDTLDNIYNAVDSKNIERYINAPFYDKKLPEMSFENQYKSYFPTMKKAENNLKYHYIDNFNKNDKDISETKVSSVGLNDKLLNNIRDIK